MFVPESTKNKVKVYEQKNAIQKNANIGHYFISYEKFESMKGFIVGPGELIVSCAGTIGEIFQLPENAEVGIINQALMKIHLYCQSLCTYFILYFDFALKAQTAEEGKGTCMKNIPPFSILKEKLFPLPPENEIRKILESIKKFFIQIDAIIKNDCSIRTISNALKNKILNQFFGENSSYKSYYGKEFKFGEILKYEQPTKYIVKTTNYSDKYSTPVLTAGKSYILGYTNETDGIYHLKNGEKVIIFDDFTTSSHLVNFDFKVKSSAMKILTITDANIFNIEYIYYLLQILKIDTSNHKRYWISEYANKIVRIHTRDEQNEIVRNIHLVFELFSSLNSN